MMSRVDMFCAGDDRHRVALLEDLLQQAGLSVVLHSAVPDRPPSDPCIVACTSRALKKPWIVELFSADAAVVALRLDDTPLPGPCSRVIDIQSWPARSADRNVGALVDWLIRHGHGARSGAGAAAPAGAPNPAADAAIPAGSKASSRHQDAPPAAAAPRRRRLPGGASETRRVLVIVAILVAGGVLLWSSRPERGGSARLDDPAAEEVSTLEAPAIPRVSAGVVVPPGPREPTPAMDGGTPVSAGSSVDTAGRVDTGAQRALPTAAPVPDSLPPRPDMGHDDALAHLCAANSLQAARAWAAALNWKQRRRAADEPCVARLLARPGYQILAPLLRLP
jgi:hypothetical protein